MNKLNTTFSTDDKLHPGDLVKISAIDPTKVIKFSSDYILINSHNHPHETLIDILIHNNITYILGSDNIGYFIYMDTIKIPLGHFTPIISSTKNLGNLIIYNHYLYALVPYIGAFITEDGRQGQSTSGLLFTVTFELKLLAIRTMDLSHTFLLFGSLFLLNGSKLMRFNPATSPSWSTTIEPDFVGACMLDDYVLVIHNYTITTYSARTGTLLYTQTVTSPLFACQTIQSKVYIVTLNTILSGTVSQLGYTITGSQRWPQSTSPRLCNLGSYADGYLVATESAIYLINTTITTIPITGLATIRSYRIIPPNSQNTIPCILNGITSISTHIFSGPSPYAITINIQQQNPILAGIVVDVIDPSYVNVIFTGTIPKPPITLLPNHIYGVDSYGTLHIDDTKPPFLISASDGSCTIIYNS